MAGMNLSRKHVIRNPTGVTIERVYIQEISLEELKETRNLLEIESAQTLQQMAKLNAKVHALAERIKEVDEIMAQFDEEE